MQKNRVLSGSFDRLHAGDQQQRLLHHHHHHPDDNDHHRFKSSFAKSMALETTKSLNFADLDADYDRWDAVRAGSSMPRQV